MSNIDEEQTYTELYDSAAQQYKDACQLPKNWGRAATLRKLVVKMVLLDFRLLERMGEE